MMNLFLQAALAVCLLASCSGGSKNPFDEEREHQAAVNAANRQMIDSLKNQLRDGDLVARSGISWESDQIRDFQVKDKLFTHIGMAKKQNGVWTICHVTGRDSITYKDDLTHYELLDSFISTGRCSAFGHYRFNFNDAETAKALSYMDSCYRRKVRFDIFFDMKNDSLMTCSEMISKAAATATGGRITTGFTPVMERRHVMMIKRVYRRFRPKDSDIIGRPIIAIDDVTTNKNCREIKRYIYQQ